MPFYEYECQSCKFYTELMQKISDPPLEKCPSCGKKTMQKLISAPVFRLKGSGWYETDFKSDQDSKRNLADRPEADAPKDEKKDEKKDKPETKESSPADGTKADKPADKTPAEKPAAKSTPERSGARGGAAKKAKRPGSSRPARPAKRASAKSARRR
jgi:putative FmdB family regulatory protein